MTAISFTEQLFTRYFQLYPLTSLSEPLQGKNFEEVVAVIVKNDSRYDRSAYEFVRQALNFTLDEIVKKKPGREGQHVSGRELLDGIRDYALRQYGPMAMTLFRQWGISRGRDFGEIVFNLIEYRMFGKTEQDSVDDFDDCYDFEETFVTPFLPPSRRGRKGDAR
jgi:uncharacterized repeat protein (TIGR04138 family)